MLSLRWPAVSASESGSPLPSQKRCSLVEKPRLPRPRASSAGCSTPFFVSGGRLAAGAGGVLVGAHHRGVHAHQPLHLAHGVDLGLRVREQPWAQDSVGLVVNAREHSKAGFSRPSTINAVYT